MRQRTLWMPHSTCSSLEKTARPGPLERHLDRWWLLVDTSVTCLHQSRQSPGGCVGSETCPSAAQPAIGGRCLQSVLWKSDQSKLDWPTIMLLSSQQRQLSFLWPEVGKNCCAGLHSGLQPERGIQGLPCYSQSLICPGHPMQASHPHPHPLVLAPWEQ